MTRKRHPHLRLWLKRIGIGLLVLLLLLIVFHRPLVFEGTRYFVVRAAKQQKLDLSYDIDGSIFSTLRINRLVGRPTEPGPIHRLEIGVINLRYNLLDAIRGGLPALLEVVDVRDVYVELTPAEKPPPEKQRQPQKLKFPALFPELLNLENINFLSHGPAGDTVLQGLHFSLLPDREGVLKVAVLDIPGVRRWEDISGRTTYRDRNLVLTELQIGPEVALERFNLDASRLDEQELGIGLDGELFGAPSLIKVQIADLNQTNRLSAHVEITSLNLDAVFTSIGLPPPIHGRLEQLRVEFAGEPQSPATWTGTAAVALRGLRTGAQEIGAVDLAARFADARGAVTFAADLPGPNRVDGWAAAALPARTEDFPAADVDARVEVSAPDVASLAPGVTGDVHARADAWMRDRVLHADASVTAPGLGAPDATARAVILRLQARKPLPEPAPKTTAATVAADAPAEEEPVFRHLEATLTADIGSVAAAGYETDAIHAAARVNDDHVRLEDLRVAKAANTVTARGEYWLPEDMASWEQQPFVGEFGVDAPELSAFLAPGSDQQLAGTLTVRGTATGTGANPQAQVTAEGRDLAAQGLTIRALDADLAVAERRARINRLDVVMDDRNRLRARGEALLEEPYGYTGSADVQLEDLSAFNALAGDLGLAGQLAAEAEVSGTPGGLDGTVTVRGRGVQARGLNIRSIDAAIDLSGNEAELTSLAVVIDDRNRVRASGRADLAEPFAYRGTADVRLENLAAFQPLVGDTALDGRLLATWTGEGNAKAHAGSATAALTGGRFGDVRDLGLDLAADYSRDQRLRVGRLAARVGRATVVEGTADLPLNLQRTEQPVALTLRTRDLDLRPFLLQLGKTPPPVTGTVNLDANATGTLADLTASLDLRARRIQSTAADQFAPADVTLDLDLRNDRLSVAGEVRQRLIEPLEIRGNFPLDVERLVAGEPLPATTPVDLRATLPRSSLAFVSSLVPDIRQIRGDAAVDVQVGGTIGAPALSGSVTANVSTLRMVDPATPPINNVALRLAFAGNRLVVEQFSGNLGGGTVGGGGGIDFQRIDNPVLDLRLTSRNALALQNDDLSVRVSADVQVAGPLNAAAVRGTVGVTRSRFFREIEILPIGLPGRPAPQPPPEPSVVSFPAPPLRDWTFDVAIRTLDPFLVESNLAEGRITMDLRLGGTGLAPFLAGNVRIEELEASLPFSRLRIESGLVYFTRDRPFEPQLNLRGTSEIRDYDVTVFITGNAANPQAVFTSDPPLPQAEVVSLIATGTTTEELGRDPNALAGRAALLAFQRLSRALFPRRAGQRPRQDTFLNRVDLDLGAVDPKTGRQAVRARLPLNDNVALIGGIDVGGNFRGEVRYLVRFR